MAKKLLIRFSPQAPGIDPALVTWCVIDAGDRMGEVQRGSLDEVAAQAPGSRVLVVVPGMDVLSMPVVAPTQNRQRLLKAVPYMLEEQLASDVEDLHFALGERQAATGQVPCAVVARRRMDEWVTPLRALGIHPDVFVAEYLTLPLETAAWTLFKDVDGVLVRTGEQSGFFVEYDNVLPMLELALGEAGEQPPLRLRIFDADAGAPLPDLSALGLDVVHEVVDANTILNFLARIEPTTAFNLLQGSYSRREQMGRLWRPWLPAAALLAAFVVLNLATAGVDYFRAKKHSERLFAQMQTLYLEAFPNEKKAPDPVAQMKGHMKGVGADKKGGEGFIGLLGGAAGVIKGTPGLELRSLRYKDGKLDVDFSIKDLQALDHLKQNLNQAGISVEILSANARADAVESRMQLRSRGS